MGFEVDNDALPTADITQLPTAMTAAAFLGIAWYLSVEVSVRLLSRATRRSLYFWSCLACSWGIIIHAIHITLLDFKIWESYGAIVIIHLAWCTYIVSQSVVLYSRLNLVLQRADTGRYVLYMIIVNGVIFGLGTVVVGMVAVSTPNPVSQDLLTPSATPQHGAKTRQRKSHLGQSRASCLLHSRNHHLPSLHS
jgi:hypothetical protein